MVRRQGVWLKASSSLRWPRSDALRAHSADAVVQALYASLQSWRTRHRADPDARPPYRRRRYFKVQRKSSATRLRDGELVLRQKQRASARAGCLGVGGLKPYWGKRDVRNFGEVPQTSNRAWWRTAN